MLNTETFVEWMKERVATIKTTYKLQDEILTEEKMLGELTLEERALYLLYELNQTIEHGGSDLFVLNTFCKYLDDIEQFLDGKLDVDLVIEVHSLLEEIKKIVVKEKHLAKYFYSDDNYSKEAERIHSDIIYLVRNQYRNLYREILKNI